MSVNKLTYLQEEFCQQYVALEGKGTKAAIAAGYSESSAHQQSTENLKKPDITARIAELQSDRLARLQITQDKLMAVQAEAAFLDTADLYDPHGKLLPVGKMPLRVRRNITEIVVRDTPAGSETRLKFASRDKAREILMKEAGMLVDQVDVKHSLGEFESEYLRELDDALRDHATTK